MRSTDFGIKQVATICCLRHFIEQILFNVKHSNRLLLQLPAVRHTNEAIGSILSIDPVASFVKLFEERSICLQTNFLSCLLSKKLVFARPTRKFVK